MTPDGSDSAVSVLLQSVAEIDHVRWSVSHATWLEDAARRHAGAVNLLVGVVIDAD